MKSATARQPQVGRPPRSAPAPAAHAHANRPSVAQLKAAPALGNAPRQRVPSSAPAAAPPPRHSQRTGVVQPKSAGVVQPKRPGVVQALRFYPNLHPGAVERVEPNSLFRLENFTDQYRLRRVGSHGAYVPNQQYNFVRTGAGEMLLHNRYRHPSIAEGRHVLYAGEVSFNNGKLEWWSNGSGHYQPDSQDATQAALPMDSFYTYQQVIKGEHKRRKS